MSRWSVIGSGVAGLCVATALMEQGETLEVIIDPDTPAASRLAGGMLAPYCETESAPDAVRTAGRNSVQWWAEHVSQVAHAGTLVLAPARDSTELQRFGRMTQNDDGVVPSVVTAALEDRFAHGLFFADEGHLVPRLALAELRAALVAYGVECRSGAARGQIIDCRGMAAADQLQGLRAVR